MQIGKIARATGTKVNTVRYYEEIGLLKPAPRSQSGRRIYADADVERLAFIRRARGLGFSVSEVRSLLEADVIYIWKVFLFFIHYISLSI